MIQDEVHSRLLSWSCSLGLRLGLGDPGEVHELLDLRLSLLLFVISCTGFRELKLDTKRGFIVLESLRGNTNDDGLDSGTVDS